MARYKVVKPVYQLPYILDTETNRIVETSKTSDAREIRQKAKLWNQNTPK